MCLCLADCKVVIGGSEGSIKVLLARSFVELHSFRGDDLITPISTAKITAVPLPSQSTPALSASLSIPLQLGTTSKDGPPSTTTTTTITPVRRNSMAERLRRSLSLQRGKLLPKVRFYALVVEILNRFSLTAWLFLSAWKSSRIYFSIPTLTRSFIMVFIDLNDSFLSLCYLPGCGDNHLSW